MSDDGPYDSIAESILDGRPVDWPTLGDERHSDPSLVRHLRAVAAVKELLRSDERAPALATWGHLTIRERIGRGSFGEVYRAWDTRLDRDVALKLVMPDAAFRPHESSIIEEGRLLARIHHPNVVTIYGAERIDGCIGLWMELVSGRTLEELVASGRRFSAKEVTSIGVELCSAVAAVHDAGLLHRDIKAHNVMLTDQGRTVLMDFGAGREAGPRPGGAEVGTPLYLAPEVLSGDAATAQSDLYSIGVLLYHLLTGSYPVHSSSVDELRRAHEQGTRKDLRSAAPGVSAGLARVIERATHPDPGHRFVDARAFGAALATASRGPVIRRSLQVALGLGLIAAAWLWRGSPLPAADPLTLAVLPMVHLAPDPHNDYLADGLTKEIIRNLSTIDGLEVRSFTSSQSFRSVPRNLEEIGQRLGVDQVVEGTFTRDHDRLRVTLRLVRASSGVALWSETFDREVDQIFGLQHDLSRGISQALQLTYNERRSPRQPSPEVYDLYLRGRAEIEKGGTINAKKGAALLDQAIATDPLFAPAYAALVDAYWFMSTELRTPQRPDAMLPVEAIARMRPLAVKAIELDPLLAEAHAAMGMTFSRECDWTNATTSFRRAIDLGRGVTAMYTNYSISTLVPLGEFDEAERLLRVALRNDPLSPLVHQELGVVHLVSGRYDEAVASLEESRRLNPGMAFNGILLGEALTFSGRLTEAWPVWDKIKHLPGAQFWIAHWYVRSGRRDEAERLLQLHEHPFRRAVIFAALGDQAKTIEALGFAADNYPQRVALTLRFPEFASLRGDPALEPLRRRLNLPQ